MKKLLMLFLAAVLVLPAFAACSDEKEPAVNIRPEDGTETEKEDAAPAVSITVDAGSIGGDVYDGAAEAFMENTGINIIDNSGGNREDADIFFSANGFDIAWMTENGELVSVDEIRGVYPNYAGNMRNELMSKSLYDGLAYSIPVSGDWAGLFVNKNVVQECGITMKGKNYTWSEFLADCETIKKNGFVPIACALSEPVNLWFEYCLLNNGSVYDRLYLLEYYEDDTWDKWTEGFKDLNNLYKKGYFSPEAATASGEDEMRLFLDSEAAFMLGNNATLENIVGNADNTDDFIIVFVPAKEDGIGERETSEFIGDLSSGYYITRSAWDDPEKQAACVEFVTWMTSDEVVSGFGATRLTALKNGAVEPDGLTALEKSAVKYVSGASGTATAVQDRLMLMDDSSGFMDFLIKVVTGEITAAEAVGILSAENGLDEEDLEEDTEE